jgi:dTMP kinase
MAAVNRTSGYFVTIEGIDGVGKTTAASKLVKVLIGLGNKVTWTREPGGTDLAETIRELVLNMPIENALPDVDMLLMFAARLDHVNKVILPSLAQGKVVVCERFIDSTYAYQVSAGNGSKPLFDSLERNLNALIKPDLTLLLDVKPNTIMERLLKRDQSDKFEASLTSTRNYYRALREGFIARQHSDPQRIRCVDASRSLEEVLYDIKRWGRWIHEEVAVPQQREYRQRQLMLNHHILDVSLFLQQLASIFK